MPRPVRGRVVRLVRNDRREISIGVAERGTGVTPVPVFPVALQHTAAKVDADGVWKGHFARTLPFGGESCGVLRNDSPVYLYAVFMAVCCAWAGVSSVGWVQQIKIFVCCWPVVETNSCDCL